MIGVPIGVVQKHVQSENLTELKEVLSCFKSCNLYEVESMSSITIMFEYEMSKFRSDDCKLFRTVRTFQTFDQIFQIIEYRKFGVL